MGKRVEHQRKNKGIIWATIGRFSRAGEEIISFFFVVAERHNYFVNTVASSWNVLPPNVTLNGFKAALDNFTKKSHLKHVVGINWHRCSDILTLGYCGKIY